MFGNGISFSGLASGLDTKAIIDQLVALERIPIQQIEADKASEQQKLDLLGNFGDLVKALQDKAEVLSTTAGFFAYSVGVSQEGIANVSAAGGAIAGSHSLEVLQTAVTDRWAFDGVADPDVDLGTADGQTVSFDVGGNNYVVTFDQASSSLNQIAAEINTAAGVDVNASVVNVGTETNPSYQLVVASRDSGDEGLITNLSSSVTGLTIDGTPGGASNITQGQNAIALVDGLQVERSDNDFSGVLEGVDIDVLAANVGTPITFTVSPDGESIRAKVDEFVTAYNEVINFVNQQNTFVDDPEAIAALFGDSVLSTVRQSISRALFDVDLSVVQADVDGYSTLSLVGIKLANDGTLSIDDATFDDKIGENLELFADLFVDADGFDNGGAEPNTPEYYQDITADSGLAATLVRAIDRLFGTAEGPIIDAGTGERMVLEGVIDARRATYNDNIERFDEQIEAKERLLESFEETLIRRFAALEELMGSLNAQGAALNTALAGVPTPNVN